MKNEKSLFTAKEKNEADVQRETEMRDEKEF